MKPTDKINIGSKSQYTRPGTITDVSKGIVTVELDNYYYNSRIVHFYLSNIVSNSNDTIYLGNSRFFQTTA